MCLLVFMVFNFKFVVLFFDSPSEAILVQIVFQDKFQM